MLEALLGHLERRRHVEDRLAVLDRDDAAVAEALAVARELDLVDDRRIDVARHEEVRVQRVHVAILDGVARGRQRLAEHLAAEHARAAQVAALAAKDPILDALELEQLEEIGEDRAHGRYFLLVAIQARDQARRIPALAAHADDVGVELIDERGGWQLGAVVARFLQTDAQVLAHPLDGEAEVELAVAHRLPAVLHLPRLRGALRDGVDDRRDVEARPCARSSAPRRAPARRPRSRSG